MRHSTSRFYSTRRRPTSLCHSTLQQQTQLCQSTQLQPQQMVWYHLVTINSSVTKLTSWNFLHNVCDLLHTAEAQANALLEMTKDVSKLNSSQISQLVSQLERLLSGPNVSLALGNTSVQIVSNLLGASPEVLSDSSTRFRLNFLIHFPKSCTCWKYVIEVRWHQLAVQDLTWTDLMLLVHLRKIFLKNN